MNTARKIVGEKAWAIQGMCLMPEQSTTYPLIKMVILGVRESVRAVCTKIVGKEIVSIGDGGNFIYVSAAVTGSHRYTLKQSVHPAYSVGMIWNQELLETVVYGTADELPQASFKIFKQWGECPLDAAFSPLLWERAFRRGCAREVLHWGLPNGEEAKAYSVKLPSAQDLEADILTALPQMIDIAEALAA